MVYKTLRERQHGLIDAAIGCLEAHKRIPCRDYNEACGYQIERAITLLKEAHRLEDQIGPEE